ncbi:MAG: hypothetical protein ACTSRU_10965 [Candidatus Hodarchaeales archaeon]
MRKHRTLKKVKKITKQMTKKKKGGLTVRPVSFGMDKRIDKYVISGGGYNTIVAQSKTSMKTILGARKRLEQTRTDARIYLRKEKRKKKKRGK